MSYKILEPLWYNFLDNRGLKALLAKVDEYFAYAVENKKINKKGGKFSLPKFKKEEIFIPSIIKHLSECYQVEHFFDKNKKEHVFNVKPLIIKKEKKVR